MNDTSCAFCQTAGMFTFCKGCDRPVCESCCRFELIGSGCGCVWPVYYCPDCVINPVLNPNAPFRTEAADPSR